MNDLFDTYVVDTNKSLHDWSNSNGICAPCNSTLFGEKLIRLPNAGPSCRKWDVINKPNISSGSIISLTTKVNFSKNFSSKQKMNGDKLQAKSKPQALELFCKRAGLRKARWDEQPGAKTSVVAIRDVVIHDIVDVNTFLIEGAFVIEDLELFTRAYNFGLGGRKTYGCGLIIVL